MLPDKQIIAFMPSVGLRLGASRSTGDRPAYVRYAPYSLAIEGEATGWELVRSADLAATASRISELEEDIQATRWTLRNAIADVERAHGNQQSVIGLSERSIGLLGPTGGAPNPLQDIRTRLVSCRQASIRVASLTSRQRQVLDLVLAGQPSKNIAADLGISQRTVDNHRAAIMRKTGSKSLPALVRTAMAAG